LAFQISYPSGSLPVPRVEMTGPVATFHQLQQLLEQSLRDLQAEAQDEDSSPDRELSQALQRLSSQLQHILAKSTDANIFTEEIHEASPAPIAVAADVPAPLSNSPLHLMTSCDGVVLMANDVAIQALGFDVATIGTMSLREWIPYEEWRLIRQQLKTEHSLPETVTWVITMNPPGGALKKFRCSVMPLLDQSRKVMAWHWDLCPHLESVLSHPFAPFVQGLEADLLNGQSLDECLRRICEGLVQTFGFPFVWITSVGDRQRIQLRAQASASDLDWDTQGPSWWSSISVHEMLAQACVASEGSLISCKIPHTGEFTWFPTGFHLQEAYSVPWRQGDISGLLVVCSRMPHAFDPAVRAWLEGVGHLLENLMARGMEMEQLRLQRAVMASVHEAVCVTDPHGRVEWVNQAYATLFGVSSCQVLGEPLRSFPHAQLQEVRSTSHSVPSEIGCVKTEVMEKGSHGESLVFEQMLTPMLDAQGQVTHFVVILHDVTARAVAEMKMKHQAYHDALTGLPNRIMFEDRLQLALAQARRDGTLLALLFLDLDNFKTINDQHGHPMGDRLLRIVAKRLVTCVRTTDTVSRLSGDEFTIILQGLDRIQDIRQVAQKIVDCLTAPIHVKGQDFPVQVSIGIAVSPKDSIDPLRLLAIADQAMYHAKECGGQRWYFATSEWNVG